MLYIPNNPAYISNSNYK